MHTRDARAHGETAERLYLLDAWRESPLYSDRERAALAWTEAVTRLAETGAPDGEFAAVRAQFSERETVALTVLVGMINLWEPPRRSASGWFIRRPPHRRRHRPGREPQRSPTDE